MLFLLAVLFFQACVHVEVDVNDGVDEEDLIDQEQEEDEEAIQEPYIFSPDDPRVEQHGPRCWLDPPPTNREQQTGFWCWAASTQMVMEHISENTFVQSDLVRRVLQVTEDCSQAVDGYPYPDHPEAVQAREACIKRKWPDDVFRMYDYSFEPIAYTQYMASKYSTNIQSLSWEGVKDQICQNKHPFIFVVDFVDGGRHTSVVGGYRVTAEPREYVEVYDHSRDDFFVMPYSAFLGVPRDFTHELDYINIRQP